MARIIRPPVTVIVVCAFEVLGLILLPSAFFKETTKAFGPWYQAYLSLNAVVSASVIWLLWKMKRIGVYVYFRLYAAHNAVALLVGNWLIYVLAIPAIGAALLLPHFHAMTTISPKPPAVQE